MREDGFVKDHPRMRGEHPSQDIGTFDQWGSSPHARGALQTAAKNGCLVGIIPACAGSTARQALCLTGLRDRPRMRGEHFF